jgi:hypothetical protein
MRIQLWKSWNRRKKIESQIEVEKQRNQRLKGQKQVDPMILIKQGKLEKAQKVRKVIGHRGLIRLQRQRKKVQRNHWIGDQVREVWGVEGVGSQMEMMMMMISKTILIIK